MRPRALISDPPAVIRDRSVAVAALLILMWAPAARAQSLPELRQILDRLERLEQANRTLTQEIRALRQQLAGEARAAAEPPSPAASPAAGEDAYLKERVAVAEQRIAEQAQTKVESSEKFPIRLTGMALFNAFANPRGNSTADKRTLYPVSAGRGASGGTFRQSLLGFVYNGPESLWGGKVHGSLYMDLNGGYTDVTSAGPAGSFSYDSLAPRLRTAEIGIDWQTRSLTVGQLKAIISPRQPESLAHVAIPPLDNAGNLWLWLPQIRFEQRAKLGERTGISAQVGVVQTAEEWALVPDSFARTLEHARPGMEGRFEIAHGADNGRRFAIAPGFHFSTTHVAGASVPSRLFSLDGVATPWRKLEFSGAFFTGQNPASLGGLAQGFRIFSDRNVSPVHGMGGWGQISVLPTERLAFHFYGGRQDSRDQDLPIGAAGTGTAFAANAMYLIAPNVRLALEGGQTRMDFNGRGQRLRNYYDLALAYMF